MSRRSQQMYAGNAALARLPLFLEDEAGQRTPMGPMASLGLLFSEQGEVSESAITAISADFHNPTVVASALAKLGAIRVKKASGEMVFTVPDALDAADDGSGKPRGNPTAVASDGTVIHPEGTASMAIGFADSNDHLSGERDVVSLREVTRAGVAVTSVNVIYRGTERVVARSEFEMAKSKLGTRSNPATRSQDKKPDTRSPEVQAASRARATAREHKRIMTDAARPTPGSTAH